MVITKSQLQTWTAYVCVSVQHLGRIRHIQS